jgi:MYXO-CTERM domain-containing protein
LKQHGKAWLMGAICALAAQANAAPTDHLKQRMARVGIGVAAPSAMSDSFAAGAVLTSTANLKTQRRPEMLVTSFRSDTTTGTPNSFVRLASTEPELDAGAAGRVAALSALGSSSVSEPHAAMLLALGLVGLALLSRRRLSDED